MTVVSFVGPAAALRVGIALLLPLSLEHGLLVLVSRFFMSFVIFGDLVKEKSAGAETETSFYEAHFCSGEVVGLEE